MTNLIRANFYKLIKTKYFFISMAVCIICGAGSVIAMNNLPQDSIQTDGMRMAVDIKTILSIAPNLAGLIIPFVAAATVGLFLEAEYTQGAIRNKLISGHTRGSVFFSLLFTVIVTTIIYFVLFEGAVFLTAAIGFNVEGVMLKAVFASLGTLLLLIIAASTALSFMIGSFVHGGKLIAILLAIQYAMEFFLVAYGLSENSKVLEFISRMAPQGCMFSLTYYSMPDKLWINCIIGAVMLVLFVVFGYSAFKKADIN